MAKNRILLKGDPIPKEYALLAGVDITPGMLCLIVAAGTIRPHNVSGGNASGLFAQEAFSSPENDIDDDYDTDGELVHTIFCGPGMEVYAWLADTESVVIGELLESNGAGALQAYTPPVDQADSSGGNIYVRAPVCRAIEAVDNGAGGAVARIQVEVL